MEFGFRETQAAYDSGSQSARAWSEEWASTWLYCPNCGNPQLSKFPANRPVADFYCFQCSDQFELKSTKKPFGQRIANGAYSKKIERLSADTNPNFVLMVYNFEQRSVRSVCVIPKHFFTPTIVERRPPLKPSARRAGWVGSNIVIGDIPEVGRIHIVRDGVVTPKDDVMSAWRRTSFLRETGAESRGWLVEVMRCIDTLGMGEFDTDQAYAFEAHLSRMFPNNNNVRPKIRQQLQVLRDVGYLDFVSRGRYRRIV